MSSQGVVVLAGGVGASRFLVGLSRVIPPERITIVGNTGDDFKVCGLRICPDLDTVTYTLAEKVNPSTGWGVAGDGFDCLEWLQAYGAPSWFQLGDRDLATHLWRTHLLEQGLGLAEVTARIGRTWGLRSLLLPMTESYAPTRVLTDQGDLHLQEYLVREQCRPRVLQVSYRQVEQSRLSPGLAEKVAGSCRIVIAPSNPLISIGPILAVPGMKELLRDSGLPVTAVSPLVGGRALKGPAAKMLKELGHPASALGVARLLQGVVNQFVIDTRDQALKKDIEGLGMQVRVTNTIMACLADKVALAQAVMGPW
ncbi:MAG: 2-phospho-L-lactate transferase [Acidobacteria bacterium]|nr:2-phospho-L-lactate transferase [Acidobacteriota bacterium]